MPFCRRKGNVTKIVASTATIRRAVEQCAALYDRDVSQFPHPALDAEDSFFAREKKIDYGKENFGRKYVGLMPIGQDQGNDGNPLHGRDAAESEGHECQ